MHPILFAVKNKSRKTVPNFKIWIMVELDVREIEKANVGGKVTHLASQSTR